MTQPDPSNDEVFVDPEKLRRTRRKVILIIVLILVALPIVTWLSACWIISDRVEAELDKIRARGEPVTIAEMIPPLIPDEENGALLLVEAIQEFERIQKDPDLATLWNNCQNEIRESLDWAQENPSDIQKLLESFAPVLDKMDEGLGMPDFWFDLPYELGFQVEFSELIGLSSLEALLQMRALNALQKSDGDEALEQATHILRLSNTIERTPLLVVALLRTGHQNTSCRLTVHILSHGSPSPEGLRETATLLSSSMPTRESLGRSIYFERVLGIQIIDSVLKRQLSADSRPLSASKSLVLLLQRPILLLDKQLYLKNFRQNMEMYVKPFYENIMPTPRKKNFPFWAKLARVLDLNIVGVREGFAYAEAQAKLTALACYIKADQLEGKAFPADLRAFDKDLITDPFSGRPFEFKRSEEQIVLYSVGEDGKDDGGIQPEDEVEPGKYSIAPPEETKDFYLVIPLKP